MLSRSARLPVFLFFFLNDTAPTEISPLSLHAALPICQALLRGRLIRRDGSSLPAEIHVHCLSLSGRRLFFTTWHDLSERTGQDEQIDRKSTRLNSSHLVISYAVFCLKNKHYSKTHPGPARLHA